MLVLSRKKDQSIVIDGGIEIQILQLKGGTVKIGINAPKNVKIVRGELDVYSEIIGMDGSTSVLPNAAGPRSDDRVGESKFEEYTHDSGVRALAK